MFDAEGATRTDELEGKPSIGDLLAALTSNRAIAKAIGITMRDRGLTDDAAQAYLVRVSQNTNVKLSTVADQVVYDANLKAL